MPDADNNFGGSLGLDFWKWWRHVQPKNKIPSNDKSAKLSDCHITVNIGRACFWHAGTEFSIAKTRQRGRDTSDQDRSNNIWASFISGDISSQHI